MAEIFLLKRSHVNVFFRLGARATVKETQKDLTYRFCGAPTVRIELHELKTSFSYYQFHIMPTLSTYPSVVKGSPNLEQKYITLRIWLDVGN